MSAAVSAPVVELRTTIPDEVLAAGRGPLRLGWRITSARPGSTQTAYEISWSRAGDDPPVATTGRVGGDAQIGIEAPGGPLRSRERRAYCVRVETADGWTAWSRPVVVEAGLLEPGDWIARPVTLPDDPGRDRQSPCPMVRRVFSLDGAIAAARLHVTALGLHHVTINGQAVSTDLLAPGWTPYHRRLLADTYDVATLLRPGLNVVAGLVGDGWYRGRLGWDPGHDRGRYGPDIGLIAQLEVALSDGRNATIATDDSWEATTGHVRSADLYDGCAIDLREGPMGRTTTDDDATSWVPALVLPFDPSVIEPRVAPPVRRIAELPVERSARDRAVLLDACQNVAGFVRLTVQGARGTTVVVRHAEVLEPDGTLHTRSLRSARATDTYVLADDAVTVLEPVFTFHGFRYAEVETDAEVLDATVIAISSDTPPRSTFACSDPLVSRLHANVRWSQRDNFVSVPTDCPQRDERLGWTGDAQAFAATASTLFDSSAFWSSWLRDLDLEQDDAHGVTSVVPDVVIDGVMRRGRAGWADAATIVPWAVFESYGDASILSAQLASMRRWVRSLKRRRGDDGLLRPSQQFGDWLDPDAPSDRPWETSVDGEYLANAFFSYSARLLADAEAVVGDVRAGERARALADDLASRAWDRWGATAITTQTGCAVALRLGIAPDTDQSDVAAALARLVREADGRVATGFLGTPLVLPALSDFGYLDEAYSMLLRHQAPSWLYQVEQGATTVWERWDAIRPDGSIHDGRMAPNPIDPRGREGQMLSFNHYAYGAVVDWIYRHLAGIAPDRARPGYRHIRFAPRPVAGIEHAAASVETPYGPASIAWRLEAGVLTVETDVPFGATATVDLATTISSVLVVDGQEVARDEVIDLDPGRHTVTATAPRLARGRAQA